MCRAGRLRHLQRDSGPPDLWRGSRFAIASQLRVRNGARPSHKAITMATTCEPASDAACRRAGPQSRPRSVRRESRPRIQGVDGRVPGAVGPQLALGEKPRTVLLHACVRESCDPSVPEDAAQGGEETDDAVQRRSPRCWATCRATVRSSVGPCCFGRRLTRGRGKASSCRRKQINYLQAALPRTAVPSTGCCRCRSYGR